MEKERKKEHIQLTMQEHFASTLAASQWTASCLPLFTFHFPFSVRLIDKVSDILERKKIPYFREISNLCMGMNDYIVSSMLQILCETSGHEIDDSLFPMLYHHKNTEKCILTISDP